MPCAEVQTPLLCIFCTSLASQLLPLVATAQSQPASVQLSLTSIMPKRHFKGNNKKDDKRRRAEKHANWKAKPTGDRDSRPSNYDSYITLPHNDKFEAFYRATLFEGDEADYDAFLKALRTTLPACFRINSNIDEYTADELKSELMEFVGKTQVMDGREVRTTCKYI